MADKSTVDRIVATLSERRGLGDAVIVRKGIENLLDGGVSEKDILEIGVDGIHQAGRQLSADEVRSAVQRSFGDLGEQAVETMLGIIFAESDAIIGAVGDLDLEGKFRGSFGLAQINAQHGFDPLELLIDPNANLRAAREIYDARLAATGIGWTAWTTFNEGAAALSTEEFGSGVPAIRPVSRFDTGGRTPPEDELDPDFDPATATPTAPGTTIGGPSTGTAGTAGAAGATGADGSASAVGFLNTNFPKADGWSVNFLGGNRFAVSNIDTGQQFFMEFDDAGTPTKTATSLSELDTKDAEDRFQSAGFTPDGRPITFDPSTGEFNVGDEPLSGLEDTGVSAREKFGAERGEFGAELGLDTQKFLGEQALEGNRFISDVLARPSDFLARAFAQRGETSPFAAISQADIINNLRTQFEEAERFGQETRQRFQPEQAPQAQEPQAPPTSQEIGAATREAHTQALIGGASQEEALRAAETTRSEQFALNPDVPDFIRRFTEARASGQTREEAEAAAGLLPQFNREPSGGQTQVSPPSQAQAPTVSPPPQEQGFTSAAGNRFGRLTEAQSSTTSLEQLEAEGRISPRGAFELEARRKELSTLAHGGMINDRRFIVGDAPSGKPTGNEEMIINPTGAPLAVVPNDDLARRGRRFAHGTDYRRFGLGTIELSGGPSPSRRVQTAEEFRSGGGLQLLGGGANVGDPSQGRPQTAEEGRSFIAGGGARFLGGGGAPPLFGVGPTGITGGNITQEEIIQQSQLATPPGVRRFLTGQDVGNFQLPFQLPTIRSLNRLSPDERRALPTTLAAEFNTSIDDLLFAQQQRFGGNKLLRPRARLGG